MRQGRGALLFTAVQLALQAREPWEALDILEVPQPEQKNFERRPPFRIRFPIRPGEQFLNIVAVWILGAPRFVLARLWVGTGGHQLQ